MTWACACPGKTVFPSFLYWRISALISNFVCLFGVLVSIFHVGSSYLLLFLMFFSSVFLKPFVNSRKASLSLSLMANLTQVLGDRSASNSIRANEGKIKTASIPTHPGECLGPERCLSWVLRKYSQLSGDKLSMSDRHLTLAPWLASTQERPPNITLSLLSSPSRMASANVFFQLLH